MKKTLIFSISLAAAVSASASLLDAGLALPYTQPQPGDLSWADQESSANPSGGYMDVGGSFSIKGTGNYVVTGITVWDVVNTSAGAPTGLSLLNANGSTISSGYTATVATYGNGQNYVPQNGDPGYPASTLYQLNFAVDVPMNAGSPYEFFLDGPLTVYPNGSYYNSWLLCANYGGSDLIPWLEGLGVGGTPTVGTYDGVTGDAYVQVYGTAVPEPSTIIAGVAMLLPFGASTLRILRKKCAA